MPYVGTHCTAWIVWVPARPLSSTSRGAARVPGATLLSTSWRTRADARISPPTALPATREARMTFLP